MVASRGEWTTDTLKEHIERILEEREHRNNQRFTDLETALRAALTASEKAIIKAEEATEKRFESVNEFRQTLSDQTASFVTRTEAELMANRNGERIQELTDRINVTQGEKRALDQESIRLADYTDRFNVKTGMGQGVHVAWLVGIGALGAVSTILSIYAALRPGK